MLHILTFVFLIIVIGNTVIVAQTDMKPPVAKKENKVTKINGYELKDDYFWLRNKKNPEVIKYLEAENAYTNAAMKPHEKFVKN
ncbi:MAG: oligopeptidase B, partial [Acidobacteria bacterium]|nr:oligopeptidase B [Acidobacteriota bacterium]